MLSKKTKKIVAVALLAAVSNSSIISAKAVNQNDVFDIRTELNADSEYENEVLDVTNEPDTDSKDQNEVLDEINKPNADAKDEDLEYEIYEEFFHLISIRVV